MSSKTKDNWVIPDADSVTIRAKKEVYPVHLICHGHKFIEEIEIPNYNYIRVKVKGKWSCKIFLPFVVNED